MKQVDARAGTVTFADEDGRDVTLPCDRRPREAAVEAGFRHALGRARRRFRDVRQGPPDQRRRLRPDLRDPRRPAAAALVYELFLDESGRRSRSRRATELTIDEWLTYASTESLGLYMFHKPREAKKLHFDVIPKAMDDYLQFIDAYPRQDWKNRLGNPVWHIHGGEPPAPETMPATADSNAPRASVTFALLLNLVAVANAEDKGVLWGFIRRYARAPIRRPIPCWTGWRATPSAISRIS